MQLRNVKTWSISLPPEMASELEAIMKRERRTKSELVREALRRYMEELKWKQLYRYGELHAGGRELDEEQVAEIVHEFRREPAE